MSPACTYHKPPALRGLVDSADELEIPAQIERLTSPRLCAERGRNPYLDPRELAWRRRDLQLYGDTHVTARPGASWVLVWHGAPDCSIIAA